MSSTHQPAHHVLAVAASTPWAITSEGLDLILAIAARENEVKPEALEAYRASRIVNAERLTRRGNVAIMEVEGPLFRRANMFSAISGATSYDVLRRDLAAAVDDASVKAIAIAFNTPGGEVSDVDELAAAIREASAKKKIVAYVGGMACSAGYWLASQCSEIVISQTAMLGSIGVRAGYQDTSKRDAERGNIEYISSQSPGKRADHSTDEGRARIQRTIDALADVFIGRVAQGRGVSTKDVVAKFGEGGVLVGSAAVKAGMADRLGSFESVISELASIGRGVSNSKPSGSLAPTSAARPVNVAAVAQAAAPEVSAKERWARVMANVNAGGASAASQAKMQNNGSRPAPAMSEARPVGSSGNSKALWARITSQINAKGNAGA